MSDNTPNIHRFSKDELQDMIIEILEKTSMENSIFSAIKKVFKCPENRDHLFKMLSGRKNTINNTDKTNGIIKNKRLLY